MRIESLTCGLLMTSICLFSATVCSEETGNANFQGRSLLEVLATFESDGYSFIYTSDLVRNKMRVRKDPPPGPPLDRLRFILAPHGLALRPGSVANRWLVVRDQTWQKFQSGRITDRESGEPLAGVRVEIAGTVVYTNELGEFEIPEPAIGRVLMVSRPGYIDKRVRSSATLDALLIPLDQEPDIEEIVVISSRYLLKGGEPIARHTLSANEVNALPELGDDALRAVIHLPGTASIGLSAKPYVRGGSQDETLILFNNVELLEPFHLKDFQSIFSGLNPSLIKSIDVYTGGFPARYGDRMSAVMDIAPADEHPDLGGEILLSFLTLAAAGYGSVADNRGTWALSGRRGNLDLVTKQINPKVGKPSYSDWYGQFAWEVDPATELEVGILLYNDDVVLKEIDEDGVDGIQANSRYRNAYAWIQLHKSINDRIDSSSILSFGDIDHHRYGFIIDPEPDGGFGSLDDKRHFQVWSLAEHLSFELSKNSRLELGARINHQSGDYEYYSVIERGDLSKLLGVPIDVERAIKTSPEGWSGGVYGSARFRPTSWMTLETGMRWDFQNYANDGLSEQFSPRLSAKFNLRANTDLRISAGRFYQPEGIHELLVTDGLDSFQQVQFADHYIPGLDHRFGDSGWDIRMEAFYKRIRDPKRRFENLFNPLVLLPEIATDRVEIAPSRAIAKGFETTIRYNPNPDLNVWLSYTRSTVDDYVGGQWQPRTWDQAHTAAGGAIWNVGNWSISAAMIWHSGWQTTELPTDSVTSLDALELRRNGKKLNPYFSLDARVSRTWEWSNQSLTLFAEVTNLTARKNVGAVEYSLEEDEDNGGYLVDREDVNLLPLVPSIGVQWKFH